MSSEPWPAGDGQQIVDSTDQNAVQNRVGQDAIEDGARMKLTLGGMDFQWSESALQKY